MSQKLRWFSWLAVEDGGVTKSGAAAAAVVAAVASGITVAIGGLVVIVANGLVFDDRISLYK